MKNLNSKINETAILNTVLYNGCTARTLAIIGYQNGEIEYSITQVNLYTGKSEYHRTFDKLMDAEMAF